MTAERRFRLAEAVADVCFDKREWGPASHGYRLAADLAQDADLPREQVACLAIAAYCDKLAIQALLTSRAS